MAKLVWDQPGEHLYETGIDRGVLYIQGSGVPWNGLISVKETPAGGNEVARHVDGIKVVSDVANSEFALSIEAYTYPDAFMLCDGTASTDGVSFDDQPRQMFDLSYRTKIGNDSAGNDLGYKIHFVYGCLAAPSDKAYKSIDDTASPTTFSWDVVTTPPEFIEGYAVSTHLFVDSRKVPNPLLLTALEDIIYGSATTSPQRLTPSGLAAFFSEWGILTVIDHGDGSWTAVGPDSAFVFPDGTSFEITWDSVAYTAADTFTISSL